MSSTITPARRARLLGAAVIVAVFLGGAFSGAILDRVIASAPAQPLPERESDRRDDRRERRYVFEQLDLAPEQRERIDRVLEHRRAQMDSFWVEARPRLRAIVDSTRDDIRAILTPRQRAEYDRLLAERDAKRRHRRDAEARERGDGGK